MLNRVMLIGRLVADPEVRYLPSGGQITNVRLVTNRRYKDKNGQKKEESEFHRIVFFGKQAENAGQYLKKGGMVYIEGRIKTTKYQAKDGTDRYSTDIQAEYMHMLDGKSETNAQTRPQSQQPRQSEPSYDDFSDDIPF